MARVLEREQLGVGVETGLILEDEVVITVRGGGRVEVHEVNRLIRDISPEDVEVVAVVQDIRIDGGSIGAATP